MKKIFLSVILALSAVIGVSAQTTTENTNLKVTFSDITLVPGGNVEYLTVSQECEDVKYAAFQMSIHFPKGIEINFNAEEEEDDVTLNETRFRKLNHYITLGTPETEDEMLVKVACIDMSKNKEFYNEDADGNKVTELFKVGIKANATAKYGDYKVIVDGIKFIKKNSDADVPVGEVSFKLSVPDPAGIENITTDVTAAEYYTVDGKKLQQAQKGLNIVRMSDGTAKTVVRQ